jgi:hypothetical protein
MCTGLALLFVVHMWRQVAFMLLSNLLHSEGLAGICRPKLWMQAVAVYARHRPVRMGPTMILGCMAQERREERWREKLSSKGK